MNSEWENDNLTDQSTKTKLKHVGNRKSYWMILILSSILLVVLISVTCYMYSELHTPDIVPLTLTWPTVPYIPGN